MQQITLGESGLRVSTLCLGTMTWGSQNTESEAHAQIDRALERGVNFLDTAEMYPVNPVRAETVGRTESHIGSWLASRGGRDRIILASKIAGIGGQARGGEPITPDAIRRALEASLTRLQTDYLDLYQFHWPNRGSYHFRQMWGFDASGQPRAETLQNMADCLGTLGALQAEGKIRAWGTSNESAWGMGKWLGLAATGLGPRPVTIQNEYSLMCRYYDTDLAELGHQENLPLLAYSPLATGLLSGKYSGDVTPEGSRRSRNGDLGGRLTPRALAAADAYVALAREHGLDPSAMAIAWVRTRPFPVVPIIGATTLAQLDIALSGAELVLEPAVLQAITALHRAHPLPY